MHQWRPEFGGETGLLEERKVVRVNGLLEELKVLRATGLLEELMSHGVQEEEEQEAVWLYIKASYRPGSSHCRA
jgi:hypothetical protein